MEDSKDNTKNDSATTQATIDKRRALLVGPGYVNLPEIDGDVRDMRDLLETFGFDSVQQLRGQKATRGKIVREWKTLMKNCHKDDAVVIYCSGRGDMVPRLISSMGTKAVCSSDNQYPVPSQFNLGLPEQNLFADRLGSARSPLDLSEAQRKDELLPANLSIEIRKVNLGNKQKDVVLATYSVEKAAKPTSVDSDRLSLTANDEYQLALEGLADHQQYLSVFRVDTTGNVILVTRSFEAGVDINKSAERTLLCREHVRGIVLPWPPEAAPGQPVQESFMVVVTNAQADLGSLELVAARDFYGRLAGGSQRVAVLNSPLKLQMIRIDYDLLPPPDLLVDAGCSTALEQSKKCSDTSVSPKDTAEFQHTERSLRSTIGAQRGIISGIRQIFKDVPPYVWVINIHDEQVTVAISRERPSRLKQVGLEGGPTGGGASLELDFREPLTCKKRLAPCGGSRRSRARFPLRDARLGVISIWKGEEAEPFIEGDDVTAGMVYVFDNTPDLRAQEADPLEML